MTLGLIKITLGELNEDCNDCKNIIGAQWRFGGSDTLFAAFSNPQNESWRCAQIERQNINLSFTGKYGLRIVQETVNADWKVQDNVANRESIRLQASGFAN